VAGYDKPDFWTLKAKKEGYPARSVYKLEEIVAKFGLMKKTGSKILDIGAAPGSWSLWLLRKLSGQGFLTAVDIQDLGIASKDSNFRFIKGSILDEAVRRDLRDSGPYSLVVSDAAPSTSVRGACGRSHGLGL
jgi:23S rRNA (uridine2552-2'-O)-methyltransferase